MYVGSFVAGCVHMRRHRANTNTCAQTSDGPKNVLFMTSKILSIIFYDVFIWSPPSRLLPFDLVFPHSVAFRRRYVSIRVPIFCENAAGNMAKDNIRRT